MIAASTQALAQRKTPVQTRSAASVDAILEATIQVLLTVGKERLTTTRVAARAGVSVGTLYQYFPNKSALLQACLRRHLEAVSGRIVAVCDASQGLPILEMGTALIACYLGAKMRDPKESAALYAVSSDLDGAALAKAASARSLRAVEGLLATAAEGIVKDPALAATVIIAAMNGISRRLLEDKHPERQLPVLRVELLALVHAYLLTCTAAAPTLQK